MLAEGGGREFSELMPPQFGAGYSPGHAAYTPGLAALTYPAWMADMKPEQQAVLLNPGWPSTMRDNMKPSPEQFEKFTAVIEEKGARL